MPVDAGVLVPFGFTQLESEVYTYLLGNSPTTGYRIAQGIGKATANTYKAIESLHQKGAILVEQGASRLCRAVPSDELLVRLTRDFEWRRAQAEIKLSQFDFGARDERVYTLRSREQVIERARHMLGGDHEVVLLACSGERASDLGPELQATAERGGVVYLLSPDPPGIAGIAGARAAQPFDELRLVVDGREMLLGLFDDERLVQAYWSGNRYLALDAYRGLAAELELAGATPPAVGSTPGFGELVKT